MSVVGRTSRAEYSNSAAAAVVGSDEDFTPVPTWEGRRVRSMDFGEDVSFGPLSASDAETHSKNPPSTL